MDPIEAEIEKKIEEIKNDPKIVTKGAIKMVVGYCTSTVATIAIHTLVPKDALSKKQKIQLTVAAWAIGGAVANRAGEWAANESLTGTILCGITDGFKKMDKTWVKATDDKKKTTVEEDEPAVKKDDAAPTE